MAPAADLRVVTLIDEGLKEVQSLRFDPELQGDLYQTLGGVYQKLGDLPRADSLLNLALRERSGRLGPAHPDVAEAQMALALLRVDQTRLEEAEELARQGVDRLAATRPRNDHALAAATASLGQVLTARGSYDKALVVLEEALRLEVSTGGADTPNAISILKKLSDAHFYAGHLDMCESLAQRALALDRQLYGERNPHVAEDLVNLGAVQFEREHLKEAEQFHRRALEIVEGWYGKDHPETASMLFMVTKPLVVEQRFDEAVVLLDRAASIQQRDNPNAPRMANIIINWQSLLTGGIDMTRRSGSTNELLPCIGRRLQGARAATLPWDSRIWGPSISPKKITRARK